MLRRSVSWFASAAILIGTTPAPLYAQPVLPPQENPAPAPGQGYSTEQLESILAPIALYPDVLLTQILMASAFPLQIVEAYRWVQQGNNRQIHGEQLVVVLQSRPWDPSVKSLVPFPGALAQMNGNLDWLQQLGFAVANQQEEVLGAVQNLRQRAYAAGSLRSNEQYVVRQEERIIYIEPPPTGVVYVPYYNPAVIYGAWSYPAYPPVYFEPAPYWGISPVVGSVLVFGAGIAVGAAFWGIGHTRWDRRHIHVDHNRYNRLNYGRPGWRGEDRWHPRQAQSFDRGGGQRYLQGSIPGSRFDGRGGNWGPGQRPGDARFDGRGGNWGQQFGPGGTGRRSDGDGNRQGNFGPGSGGPGRGLPPGNQFRDRGAPGTVGNSGIVPPGQQFRDRGAPGTVGNSGIVPPGRRGQDDGPGGGPGGGQNWRRQGDGPGADRVVAPGGGQNFRRDEGGSPQFRPQNVPRGDGGPPAVRRFEGAPGGPPGGGGQGFRREGGGPGPQGGAPGGGGQNFRREAVGAPQGGGGHPGGGGGGGGGGQTVRQGGGGGPQPGGGGGGGGRGGNRDERRGDRN